MGRDDATRRVSKADGGVEFDARATRGLAPAPEAAIPRGTSVGRYIIIDAIGQGGMGHVYLAYDPELARRVAIKTVRRSVLADLDSGSLLLAEAQSLAKLSHPNVVAVYDAGSLHDSIFIAMEHIEGITVYEWLRREPRPSWREILDVFVRAGRGLAAAHREGIVHRDFKPNNVMVDAGEGGGLDRVRVLDFGLARRAGDASTHESPEARPDAEKEGVVFGTPGFMAPEHLIGRDLDARSDQFSFCVSLWSALYGRRPFAGQRVKDLLHRIETQRFQEAERWVGPGRLRRHLRRGLQFDPDDRYPNMDALLGRLAADHRLPVRRAVVAVAGVSAAGFLGAGYLGAKSEPPDPCPDAADALHGVWDEPGRAAVERAFLATARPYAADAWSTVREGLDAYAARWVAMRNEACEATRVRGEQSEELFDRRMRCLSERRSQLEATAALLADADDDVVRGAAHAVSGLGSLTRCSDTALLTARVTPPRDDAAARVEQLEGVLAKARALARAAAFDEAAEAADRAVENAQRIGYAPVLADALMVRADVLFRRRKLDLARDAYLEAMWVAVPAEHDYAVCDAWVDLVRLAAFAADYETAERYSRHARAFIDRLPETSQAEARLSANLAYIAQARGDLSKSLELYREALVRAEAAYGERDMQMAAALNNIGTVHGRRGEHDEALRYFRRGHELIVAKLGPSHPDVGTSLNNIAISLEQLGDIEGATQLHVEALGLREAGLGPEHPDVATAYQNLGALAERRQDYRTAATYMAKALRIKEKALGADHPRTALSRANLALAYSHLERWEEARPLAVDALAQLQAKFGDDHPMVYYPLVALGRVERAQGHYDEAARVFQRAVDLRIDEADALDRADAEIELARTKLALGDTPGARALARAARERYVALGAQGSAGLAKADALLR